MEGGGLERSFWSATVTFYGWVRGKEKFKNLVSWFRFGGGGGSTVMLPVYDDREIDLEEVVSEALFLSLSYPCY